VKLAVAEQVEERGRQGRLGPRLHSTDHAGDLRSGWEGAAVPQGRRRRRFDARHLPWNAAARELLAAACPGSPSPDYVSGLNNRILAGKEKRFGGPRTPPTVAGLRWSESSCELLGVHPLHGARSTS
jgi:hypothetical protein